MPKGRFAKLTIPLYYQGHIYRAGSRIRITIAAPATTSPSGPSPRRSPAGDANVTVAFSPNRSSRLILPFVPKVEAPTPLPPVPGAARRAVPHLHRPVAPAYDQNSSL